VSHQSSAPDSGGASDGAAARLTLRALVGSALAVLPLLQLLTDVDWLIQAWISMAIVIVPAALLRLHRAPSAWHLIPGLVVVIGYLTRLYLPDHAWLGVIPTGSTWTDLHAVSTALGDTVRDSAAPLHSTAPVRLYLSIGLVLLAVIIDVVAVELRRPALAGAPMLLIYTLAGAVPRDPVSWIWFAGAGAGYLLLLSGGSVDDLRGWGRLVSRPQRAARTRLSSALSGRRIGLTAIAVAVLVPFVVPLASVNVLANALHNGRVGSGGNGKGSTGIAVDPLAVLRGQLVRSSPINLFSVNVSGPGAKDAFYLRSAVLEDYNGKAWVQGPSAALQPASGVLSVAPAVIGPSVATSSFKATVSVGKLGGTAPVFATPTQLSNIPSNWAWDSRYGVVSGNVSSGLHYTETVAQPDPSSAQLEASTAVRPGFGSGPQGQILQTDLNTDNIPQVVKNLVTTITASKTTPYDKADALSTYFTNPANGFVYSLSTKSGESGNDLVDFLTTGKAGFCQQYAAALGVMLRVAGIPARVVIGYTHPPADIDGQFEVTSDDAHAWVEAYFTGIGWLPFDPTPLTGADAARAVALPWAPHPTASSTATSAPGQSSQEQAAARDDSGASSSGGSSNSGSADATESHVAWIGLAVVVFIALIAAAGPWFVRVRRRRLRLRRSRDVGPEPLWDELADTARDLHLGWSTARTTRQVTTWIGEMLLTGSARASLAALAARVERGRYAADAGGTDGPAAPADWVESGDWKRAVDELSQVRTELISAKIARVRWRARLLPASLRRPKADGPVRIDLIASSR
jgi:transglutaminase-like putative cysteine protease